MRIAAEASAAAKAFITDNFGKEYAGSGVFGKKSNANVQDAHEAIRPTDINMTPAMLAPMVTNDQLKLYTLIYNRFLASQMADAVFDTVAADIDCGIYTLHATGSKIKFAGFIKAYNPEDDSDRDMAIPHLQEGETLNLEHVTGAQQKRNKAAAKIHSAAAEIQRRQPGKSPGGAWHRPTEYLRADDKHDIGA